MQKNAVDIGEFNVLAVIGGKGWTCDNSEKLTEAIASAKDDAVWMIDFDPSNFVHLLAATGFIARLGENHTVSFAKRVMEKA